jgi:hypothetical protein
MKLREKENDLKVCPSAVYPAPLVVDPGLMTPQKTHERVYAALSSMRDQRTMFPATCQMVRFKSNGQPAIIQGGRLLRVSFADLTGFPESAGLNMIGGALLRIDNADDGALLLPEGRTLDVYIDKLHMPDYPHGWKQVAEGSEHKIKLELKCPSLASML